MTKKAFKYAMQRGLGSCVMALKNEQKYDRNEEIRIYANRRIKCFSKEIYASDG